MTKTKIDLRRLSEHEMNELEAMIARTTSRRKFLSVAGTGAALAATGTALSACSGPNQNVVPSVIDAINKVIAGTCSIVPVVATLVDVIVTVFPQAAGVATITDEVAKQIASFVCGLVKQSGFKEGEHPTGVYKAKLNDSKTVDLHFYTVVNNKLVFV